MRSDEVWFEQGTGRACRLRWTTPRHLRVEVIDDDTEVPIAGTTIGSPFHGNFGDATIVVSPRETHVAIYMHSGQGEQGYELFRLEPFAHLPSISHELGIGGPPVFSPGETCLAMLCEDGAPGVRTSNDGTPADIAYSQLLLQRVGSPFTRHYVTMTAPFPGVDPSGWPGIRRLRFVDDERLEIVLPWGTVIAPLPSANYEEIVIPPPALT